jgi:hypothetical protein
MYACLIGMIICLYRQAYILSFSYAFFPIVLLSNGGRAREASQRVYFIETSPRTIKRPETSHKHTRGLLPCLSYFYQTFWRGKKGKVPPVAVWPTPEGKRQFVCRTIVRFFVAVPAEKRTLL